MPSKTRGFKVLSVVLLLLLSISLLAACTATPPPVVPPSPPPTEPPEEGQTITLITPDAKDMASPEKNAKYQIQTRLTDFQLLSESEGLAWGLTKNELRMYITKDNGQTWLNISPSANVQFPSNPVYGKEIFFTDPQHGWIIRGATGMVETIVLRTTDGGQSWKVSSLPDANPISSIYFYSTSYGWLMTSWESTQSRERKALYATVDGGKTWKSVMQNEQYNPKLPNPAIPIAGVTTGMIFRDNTHGFVTLQTGALPKIYATKDGGKSWQQGAPFQVNEQFEGCDRVITGKPEFFDGGRTRGWMSVGCQKDKDGTIAYDGYFTANGGDNWKLVPFSYKARAGLNRQITPTFLNLTTGWILDGSILYQTQDQGATWTALKPSSVLEAKLKEYPEIVKLQFFSAEVGWLLIEKKEEKRSILLQTTNGGVSWRVL